MEESYVSAVTELRLIMSYSDKDAEKTPASQTSNDTLALNTLVFWYCCFVNRISIQTTKFWLIS